MSERTHPSGEAVLPETAAMRRLRRRIDQLDRRIVALLNERADLALAIGREKQAAGRRAIRDLEREREVLLRISMANDGPLPQADLLAIYRRVFAATRALEARDRARRARGDDGDGGEGDGGARIEDGARVEAAPTSGDPETPRG